MGRAAIVMRLFGRTLSARLFLGGLLLLLLITTRWAWIDYDGGVPSLNEYGYFATDEGYYCGGGRQKYLRDRFISHKRAAPCTYAVCPSTHVMTWWAFLLFGQTTWAHRVFPLLLCSGAWLTLFAFLARRTLPWLAFLLCAFCLLNPFLMVYGRTACNDTLMGSLLLIGYVLARRPGARAAAVGGLVFGLGLWVKMSIWVLFPLGLSAAAMAAEPRLRLRRMGLFLACFAGSALASRILIRLLVHADAVEQGVSIDDLMRVSNSSYPLPNVFDWSLWAKALSSFPRCPTDGNLSVWIALFAVLPALLLLRRLAERPRRWDGRLLLYATLPVYSAGILVLPVYYSHYFIPAIMFVPVLWQEARHDLKRWAGGRAWLSAALGAAALAAVLAAYHTFRVYPTEVGRLNQYVSNAYNLPALPTWTWSGGRLAFGAAALALLGLAARQRRPTAWAAAALLLSAAGAATLCFSTIPLCEAHKYVQIYSAMIREVAFSLQASVILLFFAVWGLAGFFARGCRWHLLLPAVLLFGLLANPVWRHAASELTQRGTLHKQAAAALARLLPDNAVVFGERAPQVLLSLKPRVSPGPNADPVPILHAVNAKFPDFPLYALIDSEHNYHYTHYERHKDKIGMEVVHTLKLPSFNTCLPADVFLIRLHLLDKKPASAPAPPR